MQLVSENRPQFKRDRLLRIEEVMKIVSLKRSSIYKLVRQGEFPRQVQVTSRIVGWPESAVLQWVQDRIAKSNPALQAELGEGQP